MTLKKQQLGSYKTKKQKLKAFKAKKALERKRNLDAEVPVDKENSTVSSKLHKNQKKRALKKKKAQEAHKRAPLSPKKVSIVDNETNIVVVEPSPKEVEKSLEATGMQDVLDFMLEENEVDVRTHRRLSASNLSVKDMKRRLSTQQAPPSTDELYSVDLSADNEESKEMEALQKIEDYQAILDSDDTADESDFWAGYDDHEDTTDMSITFPFSNQMQEALLTESMTAHITGYVVRENVRSINDIDGVSTVEQDGIVEFMSRTRAASRAPMGSTRDRHSSLSSLISSKKGHVEYKIRMTLGCDDANMTLWRRYSDFVTFYTALKTAMASMESSRSFIASLLEKMPTVPALPSKQTMTMTMNSNYWKDSSFLALRMTALQQWLEEVLTLQSLSHHTIKAAFEAFIEG